MGMTAEWGWNDTSTCSTTSDSTTGMYVVWLEQEEEFKRQNTNKNRWKRKKAKNFCKKVKIFKSNKQHYKKRIRKMSNRGK